MLRWVVLLTARAGDRRSLGQSVGSEFRTGPMQCQSPGPAVIVTGGQCCSLCRPCPGELASSAEVELKDPQGSSGQALIGCTVPE